MSVDNIRLLRIGKYACHTNVAPLIAAADWGQRMKKYVNVLKPIDDAALDTEYEWPLFHNCSTHSLVVTGVTIVPFGALTADDTDFRTVSINQRVAAGDPTVVASVTTETTGTGDWVALTPITITLAADADDLVIPTLGDLSLHLVASGAGIATPPFSITIEYYEL